MSWLTRLLGKDGVTQAQVEAYLSSLSVSTVCRGAGYTIEALTGTLAAASNGPVFAMRQNPGATKSLYIVNVDLDYNTIVAFTTPVTQRRLVLTRGVGAPAAGGTAIADVAKHDSGDPDSGVKGTVGGDARVSAAAVLTTVGVTFDALNLDNMILTQFGAANARLQKSYVFAQAQYPAVRIRPGEVFFIRTAGAFDAAGTWQLGINIDYYEM